MGGSYKPFWQQFSIGGDPAFEVHSVLIVERQVTVAVFPLREADSRRWVRAVVVKEIGKGTGPIVVFDDMAQLTLTVVMRLVIVGFVRRHCLIIATPSVRNQNLATAGQSCVVSPSRQTLAGRNP